MADGEVKYRFLADVAQAEANLAKLERKLDAQEHKLKQVSRTSRKGAQQQQSDFQTLVTGAGQFAAGIGLATTATGLLSAAIGRVKGEFSDLLDRQRQAAQSQQTFAQAFDSALLNFGTGPDASAKNLEKLITKISGATGADQRQVAIGLSTALSARGNLSIDQVEEAVTSTLKLTRNVQDAQAPISGAVLDLQKNFNASADEALGFLLDTGQQARVTSAAQIAQNIGPAIVSVATSGGDTPREASALVAALSQATADSTGATSGTAAIALDRQLEVALPGLQNITKRIEFLQQNEEAREAFFKGGDINGVEVKPASFELKSRTAIEGLLSGGKTAELFRDAFTALPEIADADKTFDAKVKQFQETSFRQNNDLAAAFNVAAEGAKIENIEGAQAAITREGFDNVLGAVGVGKTGRDIANAQFEIASRGGTLDPLGTTIDLLDARADELRQTRTVFASGIGPYGAVAREAPPSQENLATADKLDKVVSALEKIVKNTDRPPQQPAPQPKINRNANTE